MINCLFRIFLPSFDKFRFVALKTLKLDHISSPITTKYRCSLSAPFSVLVARLPALCNAWLFPFQILSLSACETLYLLAKLYTIWRNSYFLAKLNLLAKYHDFRQIVCLKRLSPLLMQYLKRLEKRGLPSVPVNPITSKSFDFEPFIHLFRQIVSDSISHLLFIAACAVMLGSGLITPG